MKLDQDTWARVFPLLEQSQDVPTAELDAWLARIAVEQPDAAAPLRALVMERQKLDAQDFLAQPFRFPADKPSRINQRVGAYTIESLLGRGGMGEVWLAQRSDGHFKGLFAVKFLDLTSPGANALERFRREGRLLARLTHPNIARLIDAGGMPDGQPYLVLEYVRGEPIDRYCDARALGLDARVRLFLDVLAAVAHAHTNLIVHRDIKPSNVLVTAEGAVKLLDFGIAKLVGNDLALDDQSMATRIEDIALTPDYAAPEQILGEPPSTATDVYQLGVLLHVLLVGRVPLAGSIKTRAERVRAALEEVPARPSEVASGAWPRAMRGDLDAIIGKTLRKKPEERYVTAAALAADLRRYLDDEPVSAREGVFAYRAKKFIRRYRSAVIGATAAVMALIVLTVFALVQMREARVQRDQARFQQQRAEAERQRAEAEKQRAEAESNFLAQMMSTVSADGRPVTVDQIMDESMIMLDRQYANDPKFRLSMMILMAERFMDYGDGRKSQADLLQAEVLAERLNDFASIARIECDAVDSEIAMGEAARAAASLRKGLDALSRVSHPEALDRARCMDADASVIAAQGDVSKAIDTLLQAISLLERAGESRVHSYSDMLSHVAMLYHDSGDFKKAFHYDTLQAAALSSSGQSNTQSALAAQHNIASGLANFGEIAGAFEQEKQTLARARSATSDGTIQPSISEFYGNMLDRLNAPTEALPAYDEAIAAARRSEDVESELYAHAGRANALIDAGRFDQARAELSAVTRLAKGRDAVTRRPLERAAMLEAKLLLAEHRIDEARRKIDTVLHDLNAPNTGGYGYLGSALSLSSRISLADHRWADAERSATEALALFDARARDPAASADVGETLLLLAKAQLGLGQSTAAAATARRAVIPLAAALGAAHPLTLEAAALRSPRTQESPGL